MTVRTAQTADATVPPRTGLDRFVEAVRARPMALDAALAVVVALVGLAEARSTHNVRALHDASTVVVLVVSAPIVLRRRVPFPAAIATAVLAAVAILAVNGVGIELAALVMGYSVIVYGPRWVGPLAAALLAGGAMLPAVAAVLGGGRVQGAVAALTAAVAVLVGACTWLAGALRRAGLRSVEQVRDRARLLEQGRRQEVRLELLAERARISREVHDVVGHSLSGIIAQADGARFAAERDPQRALAVLADIAATGREALGDIRGLLATLRDAPDDTGETDAAPGVGDVPALVERVRTGGLPVRLSVTGTPRTLPAGAGVAAYRAVQEALTNVIKHAGPASPTRVALGWGDHELHLEVDDDGGPHGARARTRPVEGGHGLIGMRERAALHGGRAEAGPRPGGGFAVRVDLPYAAAP